MQQQNGSMLQRCVLGLLGSSMFISMVGCTDGIFYKMKSMNPYYRNQWEKDRQLGTTFSERLEEITVLQSRIPSMEVSEQEKWARLLQNIIASDKSPEMRAIACQTASMIPGPTSLKALNTAAFDQSEKVRLMACNGLKERADKESRDMLMTMASNSKESPSVRRAAIAGLSKFNDEEVKGTLARVLDDKSPVIQYQTALSLKTVTGRDYGGDIDSWREYMAGKDVPEPEKSLVASFWESMGLNR